MTTTLYLLIYTIVIGLLYSISIPISLCNQSLSLGNYVIYGNSLTINQSFIYGDIGLVTSINMPYGIINGDIVTDIPIPYNSSIPPVFLGEVVINSSTLLYTYEQALSLFTILYYTGIGVEGCNPITTNASNTTYTPGIYCINGSYSYGSTYTIDGQGHNESIFVFLVYGNYQAIGGQVTLVNNAQPCNIFYMIVGNMETTSSTIMYGVFLIGGSLTIGSGGDTSSNQQLVVIGFLLAIGVFNETTNTSMNDGIVNGSLINIQTCQPVCVDTLAPTLTPTIETAEPTELVTISPTLTPTLVPTLAPTLTPTLTPTHSPTSSPTHTPTHTPTHSPTHTPTHVPTTATPTIEPTMEPTDEMAEPTELPTQEPGA